MGRPRKQPQSPTSEHKLDKITALIRAKIQKAIDRNTDAYIAKLEYALDQLDQPEAAQRVARASRTLPQAARSNPVLHSGQGKVRKCRLCRKPGHRADKCPNPKADDGDDGDSDGEPPRARTNEPLVWDEQLRLIRLFQKTGDRRALEHLVRSNIGLVHRVAKASPWHSMDYEDVVQEGLMGLVKGIEKFDPDRGMRLSTYATWWIRHNIVRSHENNGIIRVPVHSQVTMMKMSKASAKLQRELGRDPSLDEIAAEMKIPIKRLHLLAQRGRVSQSLDQVLSEDGETALHELLADSSGVLADDEMEAIESKMIISEAIARLPERDQAIIRLRYLEGDGLTLREVGEMMTTMGGGRQGISRERVRQIEREAMKGLRAMIKRKHRVIDAQTVEQRPG